MRDLSKRISRLPEDKRDLLDALLQVGPMVFGVAMCDGDGLLATLREVLASE